MMYFSPPWDMFNTEVCMKALFAFALGLLAFFPLAAQDRGGSQALGADVSGALSQMGDAL